MYETSIEAHYEEAKDELRLIPLSWFPSLIAFICVAGFLYITHHFFIPWYTRTTGHPYFVGYLLGWIINVTTIFIAALVAYRLEGNKPDLNSLSERFRLKKISGRDWFWTAVVLLVVIATYFGLGFTSKWLASCKVLAPHPDWPPELGPKGVSNLEQGVLFGMNLKDKWWILIVYFMGWIFNIIGEEFWYRGWMLPRQEVAFGKLAWLMNGAIFTFQHWMQPWNFLAILPGALFMSYVIQLRKNTWIGIIQHGLINLGLFIHVLRGVMG
jgi:membrane protease YdiL (CAAX protease family)